MNQRASTLIKWFLDWALHVVLEIEEELYHMICFGRIKFRPTYFVATDYYALVRG